MIFCILLFVVISSISKTTTGRLYDFSEPLIGGDALDCGCHGNLPSKRKKEAWKVNQTTTATGNIETAASDGGEENDIVYEDSEEDLNEMNEGVVGVSVDEENVGLWPLTWREIFATIIIVVGTGFISTGGIGGGIYIPTLLIVAGYSVEMSLPISSMIVFGSFSASLILLLWERHPNPEVDRPKIDYNLGAIAQPIMLAGSTIGVIFNIVFPRWMTLIVMISVLLFSSGSVMKRGVSEGISYFRRRRNGEDYVPPKCSCGGVNSSFDKQENDDSETSTTDNSTDIIETSLSSSDITESSTLSSDTEAGDLEENREAHHYIWLLKKYESLQIQPFQILLFFFVQIFVTFIAYLRGSPSRISFIGVDVCGDTWYWYWILTMFMISSLTIVSYIVSSILYYIHEYKKLHSENFLSDEKKLGVIPWTSRNSFFFPILFFLTGIIVGFAGVCGCMVFTPLFLQLGVLSEVGCATSTILTIFTTSASVIQYFFMGRLKWDYSLWYGGLAFLAAIVGRYVISIPVNKLKMRFVLTIIVALVIFIGTIALAILQLQVIYDDYMEKDYGKFWFDWIC